MAPFDGRPKRRAGVAARTSLSRSTEIRPRSDALGEDDAQQRLDARAAVADLGEGRRRDGLLGVEPIGDVVAPHDVQDPVAQPRPQLLDVGRRAQRRRDHPLDDLGLVGIGVERIGEGEVVRAGLGVDRLAARLGLRHRLERLGAREVDDVERRLRPSGHLDRLARRRALGARRPRQRVEAAGSLAAAQRIGHERVDDRRLLAVHLEHPAVLRRRAERPVEVRIGQAEVVDHEGLERRHAGLDEGRKLADRVVLLPADDGAQAVVDRRLPRRAARGTRRGHAAATARRPR